MKVEELIRLVETVSQSSLAEFKYEKDDEKICLKKQSGKTESGKKEHRATEGDMRESTDSVLLQTAMSSREEYQSGEAVGEKVVKSPLVGTFYAAPSEDAAAFVKVGDTVEEGQVLAIVEAMKLMNEIESEYSGTVTKILVKNQEAVEYGQPLFVIR